MDNNFVAHLFNNLEIITASVGGITVLFLISSGKTYSKKNNLTKFIIKHNKQKDSINKRTKSSF